MFYKKEGKIYSKTKKTVTINSFSGGMNGEDDECVRQLGYSELSYNFNVADGALKDGEGISTFNLGIESVFIPGTAKPLKIYYYKRYDYDADKRDDKFLCYCSDGYMYYFNLYGSTFPAFTRLNNLIFTSEPTAINYNYNGNDVLLISSVTDGLKILNGLEVTTVDGAPDITSACVHNERIFATTGKQGTSLWFSDDFDPTNWNVSLDEAGFINMVDSRGDMLKVVSFGGYLYVFRSYGIARVNAVADQTEFSVANVYTSQGKIYGKSVTTCASDIIYLAEDGFYRFNGVSNYRVLKGYDKYLKNIDNSNAEGVFTEGKLYVRLNMRIDKDIETVILVYKLDDKSSYLIYGSRILSLGSAEGEVRYAVCVRDDSSELYMLDNSGCAHNVPLPKLWRSATTDFDIPAVKKRLEKIRLITDNDIELTVVADKTRKKTFKIKGGGAREVKPYIKGEVFSFEIKSRMKNTRVVSPSIVLSWY